MSLAPNIIRYPTLEEKEETSTYFLQEKGFPGIIGNAATLIFITNILQGSHKYKSNTNNANMSRHQLFVSIICLLYKLSKRFEPRFLIVILRMT